MRRAGDRNRRRLRPYLSYRPAEPHSAAQRCIARPHPRISVFMPSPSVVLRTGSYVVLVVGMIGLSGCEPPPAPTFPVSGKVTFQNKPMTVGNVIFTPDSSKGNNSKEKTFGFI